VCRIKDTYWVIVSKSKFSIAFNVSTKNEEINTISTHNKKAVCGCLSRLKNGPIIVKINPKVDEMKNLGNLNILSQKSDILNNCEILND
jgi:hypothetical protein